MNIGGSGVFWHTWASLEIDRKTRIMSLKSMVLFTKRGSIQFAELGDSRPCRVYLQQRWTKVEKATIYGGKSLMVVQQKRRFRPGS